MEDPAYALYGAYPGQAAFSLRFGPPERPTWSHVVAEIQRNGALNWLQRHLHIRAGLALHNGVPQLGLSLGLGVRPGWRVQVPLDRPQRTTFALGARQLVEDPLLVLTAPVTLTLESHLEYPEPLGPDQAPVLRCVSARPVGHGPHSTPRLTPLLWPHAK